MSADQEIWASSSKCIISTIPRVFLDEHIHSNSLLVNSLTAKNIKIALKLLNENENEVLNHSDEHELFFSSYAALVTHFLCNEINSLSKSDMGEVEGACRVLLTLFLNRIANKNDNCATSKKQLAVLIRSLCRGVSGVAKTEVSMLITHLIFAQTPDDKKDGEDDDDGVVDKNSIAGGSGTNVGSSSSSGGLVQKASLKATSQLEKASAYEKMMEMFEDGGRKPVVMGGMWRHRLKKPSSLKPPRTDNDLYNYVPITKRAKETSSNDDEGKSEVPAKSEMAGSGSHELQEAMAGRCLRILQRHLHGNDVLLSVCSNLPALKRFEIAAFSSPTSNIETDFDAGVDFTWPTSYSEASHVISKFQQVLTDISLVSRLFSLPILEPLTSTRLQSIINIATSCLHAAISATIATGLVWSGSKGKEEDADNYAGLIMQKSIDIFNLVSITIEKSSKAGGPVFLNYHLMGAWAIFKGLQSVLFLHSTIASSTISSTSNNMHKMSKIGDNVMKGKGGREGKGVAGKEGKKVKEHEENKLQINFNPLFVSLITQALKSLHIILADLEVESLTSVYDVDKEEIKEDIKLFEAYSAVQRTRKLTKSIYFSNLFHFLLTHLFKKALAIGNVSSQDKGKQGIEKTVIKLEGKEGKSKEGEDVGINSGTKEGRSFDADSNSSDSNTFYEEEFSSSQDDISFEDDDSVSNLSHWFEEVQAVDSRDSEKKSDGTTEADANKASRLSGRQSNNDNTGIEKKETEAYIRACIEILNIMMRHFINSPCSELVEHFSTTLTEDHVTQLAEIILQLDLEHELCFVSDGDLLFQTFSKSLSSYVHALLSKNLLSDHLQVGFLDALQVSVSREKEGWCLKILPCTLSVLIQTILIRQQQEASNEEVEVVVTKKSLISASVAVRNIWSKFVNSLHAEISSQTPIPTTEKPLGLVYVEDVNMEHLQALLFLFYQLKLSDKKLIWQHLCSVVTSLSSIDHDKIRYLNPILITRFFQLIEYLLKNFYEFRSSLSEQVSTNIFGVFAGTSKGRGKSHRNQFYELSPSSEYNNQEGPKVDGLACSFILNRSESLDYNKFYDSILTLMSTGACIFDHQDKNYKVLSRCLLHHLNTTNRLLAILPPSVNFFTKLEHEVPIFTNAQVLLHTFKWVARINVDPFQVWTIDFLVKQGLTHHRASDLMSHIIRVFGKASLDVSTTCQYLELMVVMDDFTPLKPLDLFKVTTIDMLLFRLYALLDPPFQKSNIYWHKPSTEQLNISKENYKQLFMLIIDLLKKMAEVTNWYLFDLAWKKTKQQEKESDETESRLPPLWDFREMMSVNSSKNTHINSFAGKVIFSSKQAQLDGVLEKWNNTLILNFPPVVSWKTSSVCKDVIPVESYLDLLQKAHLKTISMVEQNNSDSNIMPSLKHLLILIVKILAQLLSEEEGYEQMEQLYNTLVELSCHTTMEFLHDAITPIIDKIDKKQDDSFALKSLIYATEVCHKVICIHAHSSNEEDFLKSEEALKFVDSLTTKASGLEALNKFYLGNNELVEMFESVATSKHPINHGVNVVKYLDNILTRSIEKQETTTNAYPAFYESFEKLVENELACAGMVVILVPPEGGHVKDTEKAFNERRSTFLTLLTHLVDNNFISRVFISQLFKHISSCASKLLPPSRDASGFSELMPVLNTLACNEQDKHTLFSLSLQWIEQCKNFLAQKNVMEKIQLCDMSSINSNMHHEAVISAMCGLLTRVKEVVSGMRQSERTRCYSGLMDADAKNYLSSLFDTDSSDHISAVEDDSNGEDSDEDSLNNKMCTFTYTKKEFMSQHWYHCHTCKMVEGVGVCTICAKVCHKDHDLSYAKYGSFFCDCGEKGSSGNCKALFKRSAPPSQPPPSQTSTPLNKPPNPSQHKQLKQSNLVSFFSNVLASKSEPFKKAVKNAVEAPVKQVCKSEKVSPAQNKKYTDEVKDRQSVGTLVSMLEVMMPEAEIFYHHNCPHGHLRKMNTALHTLHSSTLALHHSDIFTPIISSQEGTLDNVKVTYQGDQGQIIRQLMSTHVLRRVSMCLLSSPFSKRQHLAVSNEKGKVTLLQLSSLLRMAHCGKKKLVVSRLCMASIPFNILSLSNCPANEDFLAVCGLKDCHILTFNSSGTLVGHIALQLALDTANIIIKALWLPGSQSELAIVTVDFVKIFDLATDAISPQYYLLLANGKIRDVTFICGGGGGSGGGGVKEGVVENEEEQDGDEGGSNGKIEEEGQKNCECTDRYIIIMSSLGHLSTVLLHEETSARSGMFYITKKISTTHADIKEVVGVVLGGGASVYFSHALQLIFFSFMQGKNFVASINNTNANTNPTVNQMINPTITNPNTFTNINAITLKPTKQSSSTSHAHQTLVQWGEVQGHPGLISSVCQGSNNPVMLMIQPSSIHIQEIEVTKLKVLDCILTRHTFHEHLDASLDHKVSSMVVLCADGSLRILNADPSTTDFWINLSPSLPIHQPSSSLSSPISSKASKKKTKQPSESAKGQSGASTIAADFFEHCKTFPINDIEFGGQELLRYYNVAQLRSRLNTAGLYIASISERGFELEVTNLNSGTSVMVGARVSVGNQSVERAPSSITLFDRLVPTNVTYPRWYDIPFTREESLTADKTFTIKFGASRDAGNVVMVDSVKVYFKLKSTFNWPDDVCKEATTSAAPAATTTTTTTTTDNTTPPSSTTTHLHTPFDRLLTHSLELLDECLVSSDPSLLVPLKKPLLDLTTTLLSLPTPQSLHQQAKSLMSSLFSSKSAYYWHKDRIQLGLLMKCLDQLEESGTLEVASVRQSLYTTCAIAHHRPDNLVRYVNSHLSLPPSSKTHDDDGGEKDNKGYKESKTDKDVKTDTNTKKEKDTKTETDTKTQTKTETKYDDSASYFVVRLNKLFWRLVSTTNKNPLTSSITTSEWIDEEACVSAMVEVMQAFLLPCKLEQPDDKTTTTTTATTKPTTTAVTTLKPPTSVATKTAITTKASKPIPTSSKITVPATKAAASRAATATKLTATTSKVTTTTTKTTNNNINQKLLSLIVKFYMQMLTSDNIKISNTCKNALLRSMRPRINPKKSSKTTLSEADSSLNTSVTSTAPPDTTLNITPSTITPSTTTPATITYDQDADELEAPANSGATSSQARSPSSSALDCLLGGGGSLSGGGGSGGRGGGGGRGLQVLLAMNPSPDVDDTMVQLAIALSLQDPNQEGTVADLQVESQQEIAAAAVAAAGGGHMSDTTVSDNNDDEDDDDEDDDDGGLVEGEGEGGADSPALFSPMHEHQSINASDDTSDSNPGSVSVSGRSSATDLGQLSGSKEVKEDKQKEADKKKNEDGDDDDDDDDDEKETRADDDDEDDDDEDAMLILRVKMLETLIDYLPEVGKKDQKGMEAISYLQLLIGLTVCVDVSKHEGVLQSLLQGLLTLLQLHPLTKEEVASLKELSMDKLANTALMNRSEAWVVRVLVMSTLVVFLSFSTMDWLFLKPPSTSPDPPSPDQVQKAKLRHEKYAYAIQEFTRNFVKEKHLLEYCLHHLHALLHSNHSLSDSPSGSLSPDVAETGPQLGQVLKVRQASNPPDLKPFFFLAPSNDILASFHFFLVETLIRMPLHMKYWLADDGPDQWVPLLAELMARHQSSNIKRKVRKVLLTVCGSKDNYRLSRDLYYLANRIDVIKAMCVEKGFDLLLLEATDSTTTLPTHLNLPYDLLISVVEHLKMCMEVATQRTSNWQEFCFRTPQVVPFLILASISLDPGVSPMLLTLLQNVIKPPSEHPSKTSSDHSSKPSSDLKSLFKSSSKTSRKEAKKEAKTNETSDTESIQTTEHSDLSHSLVQNLFSSVKPALLKRFIICFLLECNQTSTRWLAHTLLFNIYQYSTLEQKEKLIDLVWEIWPDLHLYGSRSAQFVDLLGYFTIKLGQIPEVKLKSYVERAICLMRTENKVLSNHPNANVYNALEGLVDFGGYYLERDPCLVCNNPEVSFTTFKLSSVKVDSKFTTSSQIVKLVSAHTISRFTLKINDLKKSKMVKTLVVYYNNKQVQAILELKNKPALWHRAKRVSLSQGQTEVKVEFSLPIVACNLMIEFAEFYDNIQATSETLQCPRCSASVPAVPGVCSNCGENVFQCHKCRAINYDEKDPFLCNTCGYCKYAKFDFVMTAKQCCAVDPIESEEDRKKAVSMINSHLESADVLYKQVQCLKSLLDELLVKMSEHQTIRTDSPPAPTNQSVSVNKSLQQLALKYTNDCRQAFEDLSKIIQKVLATRKELVEYDHLQQQLALSTTPITTSFSNPNMSSLAVVPAMPEEPSKVVVLRERRSQQQCYGCAIASVEQCITLLRAMSTNPLLKDFLCGQGLIKELFNYNLRRGSAVIRSEARHLLCLMSTNHSQSTSDLLQLLQSNVEAAMSTHYLLPDFAASVRHEMLLLSHLLKIDDGLWEDRLRCVMKLFCSSTKHDSPSVLECVSLPCLCILQQLTKPPPTKPPPSTASSTKVHKKNRVQEAPQSTPILLQPPTQLSTNFKGWMEKHKGASFEAWVKCLPISRIQQPSPASSSSSFQGARRKKEAGKGGKVEVRQKYLMEKYFMKWRFRTKLWNSKLSEVQLSEGSWMRRALFSATSANIRATQCSIIEEYCKVPGRKQAIIDILTSCLGEVGMHGDCSSEFLNLYKKLISGVHWRYYLVLKGTLLSISGLIREEIEELQRLEVSSLTSDLSQGYALNALTNLLADFLEVDRIRHHYKSKLVGSVLDGYLSLKKLVVQRTKLIDDTQEKLLKLLEEMTTGTELETRQFMAVCVETVNKYPLSDHISPVFIFERLCNIIYPKNNDAKDFQLSLEKDPQQEDFLQGRMLGNPYNSTEAGLGPLMRDVKNKICQDCDLVALLEDDTGMELLVSNKIISLDLSVKEVYKRIWLTDHSDMEAMRIVYRMRGLLGDATEDMVNSLESRKDSDVDCEQVYRMASVMAECNGLKVMLDRLAMIRNLVTGKQLMVVLLKLFTYCLKLKVNKRQLLQVDMQCITKMLGALNLALLAEQENSVSTKGQTLTEQILQIMEVILLEASTHQEPHLYKQFSKCCGDKDQLMMLLDRINSPFVRSNPSVLQALMRLIPFLAYGDDHKMMALINHFTPYLHFERYDREHTEDEHIHLDCFCCIAQGIENNANGRRLKDLMDSSFVDDCLSHILKHSPTTTGSSILIENKAWKDLISKASLPFVLRILTGLCTGHDPIKMKLVQIIPTLHTLEQISSDERVGSLAENLLEAMKENVMVAEKIDDFRKQTKAEKKKLAMAMRKKQLNQLGMMTNEKGQLKVNKDLVEGHHMEALKEEVGLVCCICREGYKNQPNKVLSIYTFSKRVNLDDFENRSRRTIGYSTVTHFNIVHYDCHLAAVRHARARDEWESAALQNGNTKCNGLLPLWGPEVLESAFASCLARHNGYLQENTGIRDTTHVHTVHDLKHLLLKFANERSFSEESGGGGKSSNVHLIPYLMHTALYVINMTRSDYREEKNLNTFLKTASDKVLESCYETEGALYWTVMACHLLDRGAWHSNRVVLLTRLLQQAHARNASASYVSTISDKAVKEYSVYKPYFMLFCLIHSIYTRLFKSVGEEEGGSKSWAGRVAEHIRHNDQNLIEACKLLLTDFDDVYLPCTSLQQLTTALDLSDKIPDASTWLQDVISSLP